MNSLEITPLGFAAGAQIRGIDLRKPLTNSQHEEINKAWLEHIVLVFPGQDLTPEEQIAFSRRFGVLDNHDSQAPSTLHPDHREILVLSNKMVGGKKSGTYNSGRNWHTDLSYTSRPAKGAVLHCKEKPPVGGDTMFANLYLALETLTPPIRALIDNLEAVHDVSMVRGIEQRDPTVVAEMKRRNPPIIHPVVRTHPETGRKSLLIGRHAHAIPGMDPAESEAFLQELIDFACQRPRTYHHDWAPGDAVLWDNRCLLHQATPWDMTQKRIMWHSRIAGDPVSEAALPN